jgi:hypothetical protein
VHVVLAMGSAGMFAVAAVLVVLLALQDAAIRGGRAGGWLATLPPVESLERALFSVIGIGPRPSPSRYWRDSCFVTNLFAQHLVHKTVLALAAWAIFACLLFGRWRFGWRGRKAARYTIAASPCSRSPTSAASSCWRSCSAGTGARRGLLGGARTPRARRPRRGGDAGASRAQAAPDLARGTLDRAPAPPHGGRAAANAARRGDAARAARRRLFACIAFAPPEWRSRRPSPWLPGSRSSTSSAGSGGCGRDGAVRRAAAALVTWLVAPPSCSCRDATARPRAERADDAVADLADALVAEPAERQGMVEALLGLERRRSRT